MTTPVTLSAGALSADITGGDLLTVSSLRYQDVELLVDPAELPLGYRVHDVRAGITLLHPWANRLGADVYAFRGKQGRLDEAGPRVTRDGNGLAIHGLTAPEPWRLAQEGSSVAAAALIWWEEPDFPFAHRIAVRFELSAGDDGTGELSVQTSVTALSADPVPVAFGWHPYFRREEPTEIDLPRLSTLDADATGLPTGEKAPQEASRMTLSDQSLDFGVSGLATGAQMRMSNPQRAITVAFAEGYPDGQIFAPNDAPVVSLEPMTAPTDALRRGTHLPVAEPERPYTASFVVQISPAPTRT